MISPLASRKTELRARLCAELKNLAPAERVVASEAVRERLRAERVWREAKCILGYAALRDELELRPALEEALAAGCTVALPRFDRATGAYVAARLETFETLPGGGHLGVLEPRSDAPLIPLMQLDLVLVPGLGFDRRGSRLGRGRGFYDRLLGAIPAWKCGVAREAQVLDEIPVESHDVVMNFLVTPSRWIVCDARAD